MGFTVSAETATALVQAGQAVATTSIEAASTAAARKRKHKQKRDQVPAPVPEPAAEPVAWGPWLLGGAVVVAAVIAFSGGHKAPGPE
jgi:hypothetical protein